MWAGVGYTSGSWSFNLLYQEWLYASQSERIVDFKIAYANFLNSSLMLHGRVDGAEPFDTGLVAVLGIVPGTTAGPVTLSFPLQVAADTEGFKAVTAASPSPPPASPPPCPSVSSPANGRSMPV